MYEEVFKALNEKLESQGNEISVLRFRVERLEDEVKKKDDIIKNQSIIIDGLSMNIHELRGEAR